METSRKKALEKMQRGIVVYKLINTGWDVSAHIGDGYDIISERNGRIIKIELKAIDLNSIIKGHRATQHLSANEIVNSTHLIISIFSGIDLQANYLMSIRQFVENSGVKKYREYKSYNSFIECYKRLANMKMAAKKNKPAGVGRLDFDFSFNSMNMKKWRFSEFKNKWNNLEK